MVTLTVSECRSCWGVRPTRSIIKNNPDTPRGFHLKTQFTHTENPKLDGLRKESEAMHELLINRQIRACLAQPVL